MTMCPGTTLVFFTFGFLQQKPNVKVKDNRNLIIKINVQYVQM